MILDAPPGARTQRHLLDVEGLPRAEILRIMRPGGRDARGAGGAIASVAAGGRNGRPRLLRRIDPDARQLRACRQSTGRHGGRPRGGRQQREQGRVAGRHGAHPGADRRHDARPAPRRGRRSVPGGPHDRHGDRERGGRHACASDPGADRRPDPARSARVARGRAWSPSSATSPTHGSCAPTCMRCWSSARACASGARPPGCAGFDGRPGIEVAGSLNEALDGADAVMTLRVQLERAAVGGVPLAARVHATLAASTRSACAWPAPMPRSCTRDRPTRAWRSPAELANGPRSLIGRQVENGVPIRMAVLALVTGAA